jgi:hypothetical protein
MGPRAGYCEVIYGILGSLVGANTAPVLNFWRRTCAGDRLKQCAFWAAVSAVFASHRAGAVELPAKKLVAARAEASNPPTICTDTRHNERRYSHLMLF